MSEWHEDCTAPSVDPGLVRRGGPGSGSKRPRMPSREPASGFTGGWWPWAETRTADVERTGDGPKSLSPVPRRLPWISVFTHRLAPHKGHARLTPSPPGGGPP
jgi:hypothetical protein